MTQKTYSHQCRSIAYRFALINLVALLITLSGAYQASAQSTGQTLTHEQTLASVQPGLDQDAARAALGWWSALLAQDTTRLNSISGNPVLMNGQPMSLEQVMNQFEAPNGIVTQEADWPMVLFDIVVTPVINPSTGQSDPQVTRGMTAQPLPQDRLVTMTMAEKRSDGSASSRTISLRHYAQHLQASQYRIVGIGE